MLGPPIRLPSILSIQFRRATPLVLGFLQFETAGGSQSSARGGSVEAFADENTIKFGENDNEAVKKFGDAVESGLSDGNKPVGSDSIADELKKFAELRDQGILTDEEFGRKKRELLEK